jgi:hypothetical protein
MSGLAQALARARFVREPTPAGLDDYAAAADEMEAALRSLPGALALYRIGSVSVPGISDIDRLVVVEGEGRLEAVWPELAPRTRELAMHSPFVVDAESLRRHRWFAHLEPLELAWGEAVALETPPEMDRVRRLLAVESLLLNHLRNVKKAVQGSVPVRPTLCELHTIRHGLALGGLPEDPLTGEVAELRQTWFALDAPVREERLRELLARSVAVLVGALAALGAGALDGAPKRLALAGHYPGVVVDETGAGAPARLPRGAWAYRGAARVHRRAGELALRGRPFRLGVPPGVVTAFAPADAFMREREAVTARYERFLRERAPGYSPVAPAQLLRGRR